MASLQITVDRSFQEGLAQMMKTTQESLSQIEEYESEEDTTPAEEMTADTTQVVRGMPTGTPANCQIN